MKEYTIGKTKFGFPCRVFRGENYVQLNNGYYIGTRGKRLLSHAIWSFHHPNDPVKSQEVIHHCNLVRDDDRIENYEKKQKAKHSSDHQKGENNSMSGKVGNFRQSHCDWPGCPNKHRRGGYCGKHSGLVAYWRKRGITDANEIMRLAYRPINEIRERDELGMFV